MAGVAKSVRPIPSLDSRRGHPTVFRHLKREKGCHFACDHLPWGTFFFDPSDRIRRCGYWQTSNAVPDARLVFVGTGTHESACRHLAHDLGVSKAVDFLGSRDRMEIPGLLRSARVFLYCSESEGLPNVLLEAQATALPVVATDIPAHREVLAPALRYCLIAGRWTVRRTRLPRF